MTLSKESARRERAYRACISKRACRLRSCPHSRRKHRRQPDSGKGYWRLCECALHHIRREWCCPIRRTGIREQIVGQRDRFAQRRKSRKWRLGSRREIQWRYLCASPWWTSHRSCRTSWRWFQRKEQKKWAISLDLWEEGQEGDTGHDVHLDALSRVTSSALKLTILLGSLMEL